MLSARSSPNKSSITNYIEFIKNNTSKIWRFLSLPYVKSLIDVVLNDYVRSMIIKEIKKKPHTFSSSNQTIYSGLNQKIMIIEQAFKDCGSRDDVLVDFEWIEIPRFELTDLNCKDPELYTPDTCYLITQPKIMPHDMNTCYWKLLYINKDNEKSLYYIKSQNSSSSNFSLTEQLLDTIKNKVLERVNSDRKEDISFRRRPLAENENLVCELTNMISIRSVYSHTVSITYLGGDAIFKITDAQLYAIAGHEAIHAMHMHLNIITYALVLPINFFHAFLGGKIYELFNDIPLQFLTPVISKIIANVLNPLLVDKINLIAAPVLTKILEIDADITSACKLGTAQDLMVFFKRIKSNENTSSTFSEGLRDLLRRNHPSFESRNFYLSKLPIKSSLFYKSDIHQQFEMNKQNLNHSVSIQTKEEYKQNKMVGP